MLLVRSHKHRQPGRTPKDTNKEKTPLQVSVRYAPSKHPLMLIGYRKGCSLVNRNYMRPIPPKLREHLSELPRMKECARRHEQGCRGRIEWHHAIKYQGRQLNEAWAIIGLCHRHHEGDLKNDENSRHYAYQNISTEELAKYKLGAQMIQEKRYLEGKYIHKGH